MEKTYKSRRILTRLELDADTDCWIPQAEISWDEGDEKQHQTLAGPNDRFKLIDEAEIYALEMAMAWIDVECVEDLTP